MKRCNGKVLSKWVSENGEHEAIALIIKKSGLSPVTVDKLIRDKYESELNMHYRKALSNLTKISEDVLFPEVGASSKAS